MKRHYSPPELTKAGALTKVTREIKYENDADGAYYLQITTPIGPSP